MQPTQLTTSTDVCQQCGWPDTEPYQTVSRHTTTEGLIVYTRCACGRLHVRRHAPGQTHAPIIARSQKTAVPASEPRQ